MKSKNKRTSVTADAVVPALPKTISSVIPVMTTDQKKMLKALGVFLL